MLPTTRTGRRYKLRSRAVLFDLPPPHERPEPGRNGRT